MSDPPEKHGWWAIKCTLFSYKWKIRYSTIMDRSSNLTVWCMMRWLTRNTSGCCDVERTLGLPLVKRVHSVVYSQEECIHTCVLLQQPVHCRAMCNINAATSAFRTSGRANQILPLASHQAPAVQPTASLAVAVAAAVEEEGEAEAGFSVIWAWSGRRQPSEPTLTKCPSMNTAAHRPQLVRSAVARHLYLSPYHRSIHRRRRPLSSHSADRRASTVSSQWASSLTSSSSPGSNGSWCARPVSSTKTTRMWWKWWRRHRRRRYWRPISTSAWKIRGVSFEKLCRGVRRLRQQLLKLHGKRLRWW